MSMFTTFVIVVLLVVICLLVIALVNYRSKANTAERNFNEYSLRLKNTETTLDDAKGTISGLLENIKEYEDKIVVISDDIPSEDSAYNRALKLSNEIVPYIKEDGGKIYLCIFNRYGRTDVNDGVSTNETPASDKDTTPKRNRRRKN